MYSYFPRITSVSYGSIIILFFLPFVTVKCNRKELQRVKGIELATGCRIGNHLADSLQQAINAVDSASASLQHSGNELKHQNDAGIDRNNFASAALLLAICGLVLSFLMRWKREMFQGIISLAGMMSLFLMRIQLENTYMKESKMYNNNLFGSDLTIEFETSYWLVLVSFLLIAAINIYSYMEQMRNGKMEISNGLPSG